MAEPYKTLWTKINRCQVCKDDERIDAEIRNRWKTGAFLPLPGIGPEPTGLPVRYILVAQEPSASWTKGSTEAAREKIAAGLRNFSSTGGDFAIRWAAQNWLVNKGKEAYLLTDLAKCSVWGNDVFDTMPRRYRNCSQFLNREVQMFLSTLRAIIPVGNEAYRWCIAEAERNWPPVTKAVPHYAWRFPQATEEKKRLTKDEWDGFREFVREHSSRQIHDRERKILAIYKFRFARIKAESRGNPR